MSTQFQYASSSFITVFNPLTVMAFGAASPAATWPGSAPAPDAGLLVAAVFCGALGWWTIICTAAVALRARFTGLGLLWLNRISGAVIPTFGVAALVSLPPIPLAIDRPQFRDLTAVTSACIALERGRGLRLKSLLWSP